MRKTREGLQRQDRAPAVLGRVAREVARQRADALGGRCRIGSGLRTPARDRVSRPPPARGHPGDGRGRHRRVPAHPPDPRRPGQRHAGPGRDAGADRGHARAARAGPARSTSSSSSSTAASLRGDLGRSYFLEPPGDARRSGSARSRRWLLTLSALLVAVAIGVPSGLDRGRLSRARCWDRVLMFGALLGVCIPGFWLEPQLHLPLRRAPRLAARRRLRVALRRSRGPRCASWSCPRVSLGFNQSALIARIARSCMLEVLASRTTSAPRAPRACRSASWSTSTPSATRWSRWSR